jgi:hypothetical protein
MLAGVLFAAMPMTGVVAMQATPAIAPSGDAVATGESAMTGAKATESTETTEAGPATAATDGGNSDAPAQATPVLLAAGEVAYRRFAERLALRPHDTDEGRFLADVENYQMDLQRQGSVVIVTFAPLPFHGQTWRGGGARYQIGVAKLNVRHVEFFQ